MKRYLVRYLVFWLPAFLVSVFVPEGGLYFFAARWFTLFFMAFGWAVNTGMASALFPRASLSALLFYLGASILLINGWYTGILARLFGRRLGYLLGGAFSYVPLEAAVLAVLDYNILHEVWATGLLAVLCAVGWLGGLLYRYRNPNPYRPRFIA